jgi:hypothetical protein
LLSLLLLLLNVGKLPLDMFELVLGMSVLTL